MFVKVKSKYRKVVFLKLYFEKSDPFSQIDFARRGTFQVFQFYSVKSIDTYLIFKTFCFY